MKKFYTTLALACAVAFGASASLTMAKFERPVEVANIPSAPMTINVKQNVAKAPAKKVAIESAEDVCGVYTWSYYDLNAQESKEVIASINPVLGTKVSLVGYVADLEATLDFDAGTLTIKGEQLVYDNQGVRAYLRFLYPNAEGKYDPSAAKTDPITATWDGTSFVFPEEVVMIGQTNDNQYLVNYLWGASKLTQFVDNTEWIKAGSAIFEDGWILPAFNMDSAEDPVEVELMTDSKNPNRFCLVDPYKNSMLSIPVEDTETGEMITINEDENAAGRIVIDATDPDFVIIEAGVYCGFSNSEMGGRFYPCNFMSFLVQQIGLSIEQAKEQLPNTIKPTTYKNGVINAPNVIFGISENPLGTFSWQNNAGETIPMNAKITLKLNGVNDVIASDENAPVEYFNLQGVRVVNPENGLYIRRQGSKATKVLVK